MLGIFLISFISAVTIYSGETRIFENPIGSENLVWTIVDNNSEMLVLPVVTFNTTNIIINFPDNMPPNSFTMVFMEEETNTIVETIYVGGGGGGTRTVYEDKIIYKDKPVEKIKEVEKIVEKEVEVEVIKNNVPIGVYVLIGCLIVALLFIIYKGYSNNQEEELKGGQNE